MITLLAISMRWILNHYMVWEIDIILGLIFSWYDAGLIYNISVRWTVMLLDAHVKSTFHII